MSLSQIVDISVVVGYLVFVTAVGIWFGRRHSATTEGYFLGDRQFSWAMVGFSLFATNINMQFFVGGTGKAYKIGVAALTPELLGGLGLALSAIIFIPLYLRTSITTLPQFLERRFNRWAKIFYGSVFLVMMAISMPLGMFTGSLAVLSLFQFEISPTNIYIISAIMACTVGLYAVVGGLAAVVVTDMIQVVIVIAAGLLVAVLGVSAVGGLPALLSALPADNLELLRPHDDPEFPWSAMLTGQLLASCIWGFSSISMLQRVLGARSLDHAQKGMLLGAGLKMLGLALFVIPGMVAAQLYPGIAPDTAFSVLTRELLPMGLSGLVLAGLAAAMMSTQDSGINAMASVVAIDLYPTFRKNASEREGFLVGKGIAVAGIIWGVAVAPVFLATQQGIFDLMLKFGGFLMLPNGLCYVFGRFWKRGTHHGCIATLACGTTVGLYYSVASTLPGYEVYLPDFALSMHYYHLLGLFGMLLACVFVIVSLLNDPPAQEKIDFIKANSPIAEASSERPWYRAFGFWWMLYIIAFFGMYLVF